MMHNELSKRAELHKLVQHTLHYEWDPIGIVDMEGPEDEYHAYAEQVYRQLLQRWEPQRIADYLHQIATVHIGMTKTRYDLSLSVANKLALASKDFL
ncbi:hypothetical protein JST97_23595 [bacterium]|nr:hypothetical protein [bacterium]